MDEYIARIENINAYLHEDRQLGISEDEDHMVLGITKGHEVEILAIDDEANNLKEIDNYLTAMETTLENSIWLY